MNLTVLGATGSVGKSTLDVVARHPERYRIFALTAHTGVDALLALCERHKPAYAVLSGVQEEKGLRERFAAAGTRLLCGRRALEEVAVEGEVVMAAIVGAAGLPATLAAARAGRCVLVANKEALVMAGPLFSRVARQARARVLPIDSEHNAVFQCFSEKKFVRKITLTASGGPFRTLALEKLATVTPDQACAHPNWVMGRKISVDSATMMNKGLEVIEARWLFDLEPARIEVLIHPQSVIHSLVEYVDGSVIAQLSNPDMRVPIAHALGFPDRIESGAKPLDLVALRSLTFELADPARFPCLRLAYEALQAGGTAPAILNAANEVAVEAFLGGRLPFTAIPRVVEETLAALPAEAADDLEAILAADRDARRKAMTTTADLLGTAA